MRRTSENPQNSKFAEFYKGEVRRMLFPRTPVNRVQEKRKDRGVIGPGPSCFSGSVSDSLGRYLMFIPRQHPIGGLGLHERQHRPIGGDVIIVARPIRIGA